jgi:hypothetical protein
MLAGISEMTRGELDEGRVNVSRYRRELFVGWAIYRFFYSRPNGTEILRRQCRLCHRRHSLARLYIKEAVEFDSFQFFFVARFHSILVGPTGGKKIKIQIVYFYFFFQVICTPYM